MSDRPDLKRARHIWGLQTRGNRTTPTAFRAANRGVYTRFHVPDDLGVRRTRLGGTPVVSLTVPGNRVDARVLHFHGGGYVVGTAWLHREFTGRISRAIRTDVDSLDYSLAPEHRYPKAVTESVSAYGELIAGNGSARVLLMGESAGAGLALGTAIALRDAGIPMPAGIVLVSPWIDLTDYGDPSELTQPDPILASGSLAALAGWYVGAAPLTARWASPALVDPTGLPPILIQVGTGELFLRQAKAYAERCARAGVDVTLEVTADVPHVWHIFSSFLPEGRDALDAMGRWVDRILYR